MRTKEARISVIIPVLNEANNLEHIQSLVEIISQSSIKHDIIFVDGQSDDNTFQSLKRAGYTVIKSKRGRGKQLDKGVQSSQGQFLLLLHADSYFDQSPLEEVARILSTDEMGCFRLSFDRQHVGLSLIAWGSNWRVRHRRIVFGDQGIFMTRQCYNTVGGFGNLPLMEDYDFSIRAKRLGITIQQSSQTILTSSRYFNQYGIVRGLWKMQKCQRLFRQGKPIHMIQHIYKSRR